MIKNFLLLTTIVFGSTLFAQGNTVFQEDFSPEGDRGLWTIGELDGDGYTWDFLIMQIHLELVHCHFQVYFFTNVCR